ncbi:MAG: hypothetical protein V4568_07125 [Pseudomonadota bacterium]
MSTPEDGEALNALGNQDDTGVHPSSELRSDWEELSEVLRSCVEPHPLATNALQQFLQLDRLWHDLNVRWIDTKLVMASEAHAESELQSGVEATGINIGQRQAIARSLMQNATAHSYQSENVRRFISNMESAWNHSESQQSRELFNKLHEVAEQRKAAVDRYKEATKLQDEGRAEQVPLIHELLTNLRANLPEDAQSGIQELTEWVDEHVGSPTFEDDSPSQLSSDSAIAAHKQGESETNNWMAPLLDQYQPLSALDDIQARMDWYEEKVNLIDDYTKSQHRLSEHTAIMKDLEATRTGLQKVASPEGKAALIASFSSLPPPPSTEERWQSVRDNLLNRITRLEGEIGIIEAEQTARVINQEDMPQYLQHIHFALDEYRGARAVRQDQQEVELRRQTLSGLLRQGELEIAQGEELIASHAQETSSSSVDFSYDDWIRQTSAMFLENAKPKAEQTLRNLIKGAAPPEEQADRGTMEHWLVEQMSYPHTRSALEQYTHEQALNDALQWQDSEDRPEISSQHVADVKQHLKQEWIRAMRRRLEGMLDRSDSRALEWARMRNDLGSFAEQEKGADSTELLKSMQEVSNAQTTDKNISDTIDELLNTEIYSRDKNEEIDKTTIRSLIAIKEKIVSILNDELDLKEVKDQVTQFISSRNQSSSVKLGETLERSVTSSVTDASEKENLTEPIAEPSHKASDDLDVGVVIDKGKDRVMPERKDSGISRDTAVSFDSEAKHRKAIESNAYLQGQEWTALNSEATPGIAFTNPAVTLMDVGQFNAYWAGVTDNRPQHRQIDFNDFRSDLEALSSGGQRAFMIGARWAESYPAFTQADAAQIFPPQFTDIHDAHFDAYLDGVTAVISARERQHERADQLLRQYDTLGASSSRYAPQLGEIGISPEEFLPEEDVGIIHFSENEGASGHLSLPTFRKPQDNPPKNRHEAPNHIDDIPKNYEIGSDTKRRSVGKTVKRAVRKVLPEIIAGTVKQTYERVPDVPEVRFLQIIAAYTQSLVIFTCKDLRSIGLLQQHLKFLRTEYFVTGKEMAQ